MFRAEELGVSGYRFIFNMGAFLNATEQHHRAIPYLEAHTRYTEEDSYLNGESLYALFDSLIKAGERRTAFDYMMERDILSATNSFEIFAMASRIAYEAGEWEQAEEWANTALALSSEAYSAHYTLGLLAYWRDDDVDAALERFERIIEENGNLDFQTFAVFADVSIDSARILVDDGQMEEALEYYDSALETVLYVPWLYEERANIHIALDDIDAARADLQEAFTLEPDPELKAYYRERLVELGPADE